MKLIDEKQWMERLRARPERAQSKARAMASTWWQGIVTDPALMMVPVEDHQVHRGDAVFEALRFIDGRVYLQDEHLARLMDSASSIGLTPPLSIEKIKETIAATMAVAGLPSGLIRLFATRGAGGFSVNPYDCKESHLHVIVTDPAGPSESQIANGVRMGWSRWPAKDPWFARIKSCNYLLNVLMKKESVDRGLDYVVGLDARGFVSESSTENLLFVDAGGFICRPKSEGILRGTTMVRACELARQKLGQLVAGARERDFTPAEVLGAREVFFAGTTIDVLAVTEVDGQRIGDGRPGPVARQLRALVQADQTGS